jgi:hypothetical protein
MDTIDPADIPQQIREQIDIPDYVCLRGPHYTKCFGARTFVRKRQSGSRSSANETWHEVSIFTTHDARKYSDDDVYVICPRKDYEERRQQKQELEHFMKYAMCGSNLIAANPIQGQSALFASPRTTKSTEKVKLVELIYATAQKRFYALTELEYIRLLNMEEAVNTPRQNLHTLLTQSASDVQYQKELIAQRHNCLTILRHITDQRADQFAEVVHFADKKVWGYVNQHILNTFQLHIDYSEVESQLAKLAQVLRAKIKAKAAVSVDLRRINHRVEEALRQWVSVIGERADKTFFSSQCFDVSYQAQLMRYACGTSISGSYAPLEHGFTYKADTDDKINLASGKLTTRAYYPTPTQGHEFAFTDGEGNRLDLGLFQAELKADLSGLAGASVQLSETMHFTLLDDKTTVLGENTEAEQAGFFAGAQIGCDISGALKWANPECLAPPTDQSKQHEDNSAKGDLKQADFALLAQLGGGATVAAGIGEEEKFKVTYDSQLGIFYIIASIETVEGIGFSGRFCAKVEVETIEHFVVFLYHQIKNHNYNYTGLFTDFAYQAWVGITTIAVWAGKSIVEYCQNGVSDAQQWFGEFMRNEAQQARRQEILIKNLLANEDQVKFAPPETKGRWLYQLCQTPQLATKYWEYDIWNRQRAIHLILKYIQSHKEYLRALKNMVDTTRADIGQPLQSITAEQGQFMLWQAESSVMYIGDKVRDEAIAVLKERAKQIYQTMQYRPSAYQFMKVTALEGAWSE